LGSHRQRSAPARDRTRSPTSPKLMSMAKTRW
jgi:hypothetical protein